MSHSLYPLFFTETFTAPGVKRKFIIHYPYLIILKLLVNVGDLFAEIFYKTYATISMNY